jgi:DNA polymerase
MLDVDVADELAELVAQFRGQLARHHAAGTWAAPGTATTRPDPERLVEMQGANAVAIEIVDEPIIGLGSGRRGLSQVRAELGECTRCKLHSTRKSIVFGVGAEDAALMFVGEAPGEQEDKRGEPFVGPAGELLDKMIEAMGWSRQTVYINNIISCRPPGNRNPQPDEVAACKPFLEARIGAIAPRIIVALGRPAANTLLGTDAPISTLRGRFHDRNGVKVMPTFHPAYLLREPDRKRDAWADLKLVMAELARLGIQPPGTPRA